MICRCLRGSRGKRGGLWQSHVTPTSVRAMRNFHVECFVECGALMLLGLKVG